MPVPYRNLPRRSCVVFFPPVPTKTYPTLSTSRRTLANFLGRRVRSTDRSRRNQNQRSRSQPPQPAPVVFPPLPPSSDLYNINQAAPSEPIFPAVTQFYTNDPRPTRNPSLLPDRNNLQHRTPPPIDAHQIPATSQELHLHIPEDLYVSSVLPTRTPRELRHFQDHCWKIFAKHNRRPCHFFHGLDESRRITTSPLHFLNFLWRAAIIVDDHGITEEYHWIKRRTISHRPDIPYLQPAYAITYPWTGLFWKVTQLDRSLPPTPTV